MRRPRDRASFGFTSAGAAFTPVGISAGVAPLADRRAVAQLRAATADADLVHAHGLRAGLVAAAARRLGGRRDRPLVLTLHNALQEGSGPKQWLLRRAEGWTVRGADLVLAVSGDLAENARRLGARDVRVAPALAPPLPPAERPGTRSGRNWASRTADRWWSPSGGCTSRRATTSCSTPSPDGPTTRGCR